nr:sulfite exporter TauE/SafE family protein [Alteromonas lipotrueiana]
MQWSGRMLAVVKQNLWWCVLGGVWLAILALQPNLDSLITGYGAFSALGIIGAVFANATGAGGGVVFVPFFHHLGLNATQIVATSFAIQCFGMTVGAITWGQYYRRHQQNNVHWQPLSSALILCIPAAIGGLLLAQWGAHLPAFGWFTQHLARVHIGFGFFSIVLGLAILASIPLLKRTSFQKNLSTVDIIMLPFIAFSGGIITAWLSVGVGELVAVYLIIRRFNITMAIAVAVILTAVCVWCAMAFHWLQTHAVVWQIVLFAGVGAALGGRLAKYVVLAFDVKHLKIFFGIWVLLMGVGALPLF